MVNKGSDTGQTVWNIDGVNITDMASLSSPAYYDFDSFEEINVSTGGADVSAGTPGIQLNLVTKRGTNDLHGSARTLITDKKWQADNRTDELKAQLASPVLNSGGNVNATNTILGVQDYGADVGGPILKDRLWLWGSYGRNQIDLVTVGRDRQDHARGHQRQAERADRQQQQRYALLQPRRQNQARP